jgi:hypothetical protein
MDDPLNLRDAATPSPIRAEQAAPTPVIVNLHKRLTGQYTADSVETRLVLLAHLIYLTYADLKEHITK